MATGNRSAQTSKGAKNTRVRRIDEPRPEYTAAHALDHEATARWRRDFPMRARPAALPA